MIKTQVKLPDELYREAKRVAREREISLVEVVRHGLEYHSATEPATTNVQDFGGFEPRNVWNPLRDEPGTPPGD